MEPELPFWGTIAAKGEDGYNEEEQDYLINEGIRIIKEFSHHPSFVMMSLGNELWGSRERLGEIIDTQSSFNLVLIALRTMCADRLEEISPLRVKSLFFHLSVISRRTSRIPLTIMMR